MRTRIPHVVRWNFVCVCFAAVAWGQAAVPAVNAVSPPTQSGQPNYTDFNSNVIPNPTVTGVTVALPWSAVDQSTTSAQNYNFSTWETNNLTQYESKTPTKVVNFIVMPATEGGVNTYTPSYVFSQAWANGTVSWGRTIPAWSASTEYLPTTYLLYSSHYQQEIATVTPPTGFDGHCESGGSRPNFSLSGGTVSDGTCVWQDMGTNAPLETQSNCQSYEGAPQWTASTGYKNGTIIAPEASAFNFHYYQQTSGTTCTSGSSAPSTWNTSGGTTSDNSCTWQDSGTTIPNDQGLPVSYNLPFMNAYQLFAQAVYNHYSASPPAGLTVGYIRFGMTQGGEASPLCNTSGTQSSGWPEYSKYTYLSYIHDMTVYFGGLGSTIPQLADMHMVGATPDPDYADQEALDAFDNNIGIGTNGLDVNDVLNITGGSGYTQLCSTTPRGCTNGDWYYNFKLVAVGSGYGYCSQTMPNGKYPICSLQTLTASTPTDNTGGNPPVTGSLAATGSFPGLIPTAAANGADNLEIYPIDTLLATSPNYCSDTGASCTPPNDYATFQGAYESAFETFLGQTPGLYSPAFGTTLASDTSDTFYWYPETAATAYKLVVSSASNGGGTVYYTNSSISQWKSSVTATMSPSLPSGNNVYVSLYYQQGGSTWYQLTGGRYKAP